MEVCSYGMSINGRQLWSWFFYVVMASSLTTAISFCGAWIRSYYVWNQWSKANSVVTERGIVYRQQQVRSAAGGISYWIDNRGPFPPPDVFATDPTRNQVIAISGRVDRSIKYPRADTGFLNYPFVDSLGVQIGRFEYPAPPPSRGFLRKGFSIAIPYWALVSIPSSVPLYLFLRRFIRWIMMRFRISHGRCVACGFDVRANLDRCPECGQPLGNEKRDISADSRTLDPEKVSDPENASRT